MTGPDPAVAQVRVAVRQALADLAAGDRVLVAVSGGADSLALVAAVAFEAPRAGVEAAAVVVDHGLQPGSAEVAERAAEQCRGLGVPAAVVAVEVPDDGSGPEAAARDARYTALDRAADEDGAVAVLLGHTLDDQAEQVLLGLARGSGTRSLAGMPARRGRLRRPLLGVPRAVTERACAAAGLVPWSDPHNDDPRFTRVRARRLLPVLEAELGPGVAAALARTAALARSDADALDARASDVVRGLLPDATAVREVPLGPVQVDAGVLAELPDAVRGRVLRALAVRAGCPPGDLGQRHVEALDALVTRWRGQGEAALPAGVRAVRRCGRLHLWTTATWETTSPRC